MVDIETLDTRSTAVTLSIGAVEFDETGLGKQFYSPISIDSCLAHGLTVSQSTLLWWLDQKTEARATAFTGSEVTLEQALAQFELAFDWNGKAVWANGADFDLPIIANAYASIGFNVPWKFYNSRCYRTLKNSVPKPVYNALAVEPRVAHDALEDAIAQALTATKMLSYQEKCYGAQADRDSQVPKQA